MTVNGVTPLNQLTDTQLSNCDDATTVDARGCLLVNLNIAALKDKTS